MRFYGGSLKEWLELDSQTAAEMMSALDVLEAREMMDAITVSTFPHMKVETQKKIEARLQRRLEPEAERRPVTLADLASILKGG